jgi:arginase family enzyme
LELEAPLYISLDLDVLDPAFAPGVSHHEPGGLSVRDVLDVLAGITVPVVGADIVEYNPVRDHGERTAMVAAKFYKELLGLLIR